MINREKVPKLSYFKTNFATNVKNSRKWQKYSIPSSHSLPKLRSSSQFLNFIFSFFLNTNRKFLFIELLTLFLCCLYVLVDIKTSDNHKALLVNCFGENQSVGVGRGQWPNEDLENQPIL